MTGVRATKGNWVFIGVPALGLILVLTIGLGFAQSPASGGGSQGELSIESKVNSKFSYQGVLKGDGSPVTGSRVMVPLLYSDDACTTQVGGVMAKPGVPATKGLFNLELEVAQAVDSSGC